MRATSHAGDLALWIRAHLGARPEPLTHLKLQKLAFYCYGAALAFGHDGELGSDIRFEAWDHGPVCRELWAEYKDYRGDPIPLAPLPNAPKYSAEAEAHLHNVLTVYGVMDAWSLRQESRLEEPWVVSHQNGRGPIPREVLHRHFSIKFRGPRVHYPEFLLRASNLRLDRIPVRGQPSLHDLAVAITLATAA